MIHYFTRGFWWSLSIIACCSTRAQSKPDSLTLNLPAAEKIFLSQNLSLLAQKYNIDAARALVIQSRLFPNPSLSLSRGPVGSISDSLYNPVNSSFFHNGETQVALSQLIQLAGKRNKQIDLAVAGGQLAEAQFYDLLRTLKNTLRNDFFFIYYNLQSSRVYEQEINSLQQVVAAFQQQQGKGYIAEKEVIRVRAQLYALQSEYQNLLGQINDSESELRTILQIKPGFVTPVVDLAILDRQSPEKYPLQTLLDSAYHNRTDLQIARTNSHLSELNYRLQKALAVPDLTASIAYDKQGSYAHNLVTAGVSMDLPFFNRNQGNIQAARAQVQVSTLTEKSLTAQLEEQVYRAVEKLRENEKLYRTIDPAFSSDFYRLQTEVLRNYQLRNIGLLDFLDFYDSFKQNTLQINQILLNRVTAFENLNYMTGTNFFN